MCPTFAAVLAASLLAEHDLAAAPEASGVPRLVLWADFQNPSRPLVRLQTAARLKQSSLKESVQGPRGGAARLAGGTASFDVSGLRLADEGTISFSYRRLDFSSEPLLTLRAADGSVLVSINASGCVAGVGGTFPLNVPPDRLSRLWKAAAVTWKRGGAGMPDAPDMIRVWTDHGVVAYAMTRLGEKPPAELVVEDTAGAIELDDLFVVDRELTGRAISVLDRNRQSSPATLESALSAAETRAGSSQTARRDAALAAALSSSLVFEAPGPEDKTAARPSEELAWRTAPGYKGDRTAAFSEGWKISLDVPRDGQYTVLLRYRLDRGVDLDQATNATGLFWRANFAAVTLKLDGTAYQEKLYPTGTPWNWSCDSEVYKFHALDRGRRVALRAGKHTLEVAGEPSREAQLNAVILCPAEIPEFSHPRLIDNYQIPPLMNVLKIDEQVVGAEVQRTFTLEFRARLEEPMAYDVELDTTHLVQHRAELLTNRLSLRDRQGGQVQVVMRCPSSAVPSSEKVKVYLWNESTPSWMQYDLPNVVTQGRVADTVTCEKPVPPEVHELATLWAAEQDAAKRAALGQQIQRALEVPAVGAGSLGRAVTPFWRQLRYYMDLTPQQLEGLVPDGPCWEIPGEFTQAIGEGFWDHWHGNTMLPEDLQGHRSPDGWCMWHEPAGDMDQATSIHAEAVVKSNAKGEFFDKPRRVYKVWNKDDAGWQGVLSGYRMLVLVRLVGNIQYHTTPSAALPLLSRMYCLSRDQRYAEQCYRIAELIGHKVLYHPRTHYSIRRDDRDNWGTFSGMKWPGHATFGMFTEFLNAYDRLRSGLTGPQRLFWQYNLVRATFNDLQQGGRNEDPALANAINMERLFPCNQLAVVFGDVRFTAFERRDLSMFLEQILSDGMHVCGLSSYGHGMGVAPLVMEKLGQDYPFWEEPATFVRLMNVVEAESQFLALNGQTPNFGHGSGNPWNAYAPIGDGQARLAAALRTFYLRHRDRFDQVLAGGKITLGSGRRMGISDALDYLEKVADVPRRFGGAAANEQGLDTLYQSWKDPLEFQPTRVAPAKGYAILRNHGRGGWRDWIEVYCDYGRPNGRSHEDPAKLHIVLVGNGQILNTDYGYHGWHSSADKAHLWTEWSGASISHATVMVDGKNQNPAAGRLGFLYDAGPFQMLDVTGDRQYAGVTLQRRLVLADSYLLDLFRCESATEHRYDWMWHNYGQMESRRLTMASCKDLGTGSGYQHIRKALSASAPAGYQVSWLNRGAVGNEESKSWFNHSILHEPHVLRLWGLTDHPATLIRFEGPENWSKEKKLDYFWARKTGKKAIFVHLLEPYRQKTGPAIEAVESVAVTDASSQKLSALQAVAVKVTLTGGRVDLILCNYTDKTVKAENLSTSEPLVIVSLQQGRTRRFSAR